MASTAVSTPSITPLNGKIHGETRVPLIIENVAILGSSEKEYCTSKENYTFLAATVDIAQKAAESSAQAFEKWSRTSPLQRRRLLLRLAQLLQEKSNEAKRLMQEEIHCDALWAHKSYSGSVALIEENASLATSQTLQGSIPHTHCEDAIAAVVKRPFGVVLGIAPWNSPLILAFRAVIAPLVAGNTVILKGSELSPKSHYFVANLFVEAGFPPGVVNFLLHRPQDAASVVQNLINHTAVRKINFTGSTNVGRIIAKAAAEVLKPVLLELGGKNCVLVLEDADIQRAAEGVLDGIIENVSSLPLNLFVHHHTQPATHHANTTEAGQVCMSTDTILVVRAVADKFSQAIRTLVAQLCQDTYQLVGPGSSNRVSSFVKDAVEKGANPISSYTDRIEADSERTPVTVLEGITESMSIFSSESFGPIAGIRVVADETEAISIINALNHGLSSAIWTQNTHRALRIASRLHVSALHVNDSTVHDESTLPHGGTNLSGYGRFGSEWGIQEFLQTQTIVLHP
ncbi:hypothetical protein NW762_010594 [Fusarium torreyae]|uniref:Aldehyde dehydrogenase domain-containing protein n=1 Tax=Fusarium torreyae TaxID=1237075 RepID=A0A9W8VDC0_9HYPO|nr:hypothetical protein NW762_010594 [Fusarium torreyae]